VALVRRRGGAHPTDLSRSPALTNVTVPPQHRRGRAQQPGQKLPAGGGEHPEESRKAIRRGRPSRPGHRDPFPHCGNTRRRVPGRVRSRRRAGGRRYWRPTGPVRRRSIRESGPPLVGSDRCLLISLDSTAVNQFLKPTDATLIGLIEAGR